MFSKTILRTSKQVGVEMCRTIVFLDVLWYFSTALKGIPASHSLRCEVQEQLEKVACSGSSSSWRVGQGTGVGNRAGTSPRICHNCLRNSSEAIVGTETAHGAKLVSSSFCSWNVTISLG